jgi:HSP20 family protein
MREHDVDRLQQEFEELFTDMWHVPGFAGMRRGFRPHVDCYRTEEPPAVTVVVELAGVDPAGVQVVVTERTVTISGERQRVSHSCRASYRQMEIEYGAFQRRVSLAEDVDPSAAEARYDDGLLTVVMPLAQKARGGRVSIRIGASE